MTVYEHAYAWAADHERREHGVAVGYALHFEELDKAGEVTVLTSHEREFPRWLAEHGAEWADGPG